METDKVRQIPYQRKSFAFALLIDTVLNLMLKIMPEIKNKLWFSFNKDIIGICQNARFQKICPRKILWIGYFVKWILAKCKIFALAKIGLLKLLRAFKYCYGISKFEILFFVVYWFIGFVYFLSMHSPYTSHHLCLLVKISNLILNPTLTIYFFQFVFKKCVNEFCAEKKFIVMLLSSSKEDHTLPLFKGSTPLIKVFLILILLLDTFILIASF